MSKTGISYKVATKILLDSGMSISAVEVSLKKLIDESGPTMLNIEYLYSDDVNALIRES